MTEASYPTVNLDVRKRPLTIEASYTTVDLDSSYCFACLPKVPVKLNTTYSTIPNLCTFKINNIIVNVNVTTIFSAEIFEILQNFWMNVVKVL